MAANDSFFQRRKPAAVLKHAVLDEYFTVFCAMVGHWFPGPVWLIDGYAGPGAYDEDQEGGAVPGSPVVALASAETASQRSSPREVRCAFIEQDAEYLQKLQANVKPFQDRGLQALVLGGEVETQLPVAWQKVGDSPVLTLLDPFGVSMARDMMTRGLLSRIKPPSEVLLNINVEAVSRHGGCLQRGANGIPELKPGAAQQGVEKADRFLGGTWWRERFLGVRDSGGSPSAAAAAVVEDYRLGVERETGVSSISVPIRRRENQSPLFLLTLFFRHEAAGYKFADAAARASRKWRDAYRLEDIDDFFSKNEEEAMLPMMGDMFRQDRQAQAEAAEKALKARNVEIVTENITTLLDTRTHIMVGRDVVEILGTALSLAGEEAIKKAWDQLGGEGLVQGRDKSKKDLWRQKIVRL